MTDADQAEQNTPPPMLKEETRKDDGRILIYYTFPDTSSETPILSAVSEDTHV